MASDLTNRLGGARSSLAVKAPCRVATTTNIALTGLQTIDGVTVVAGDRVLVKNQTASGDNGIYVASETAWTRDRDFDGPDDIVQGSMIVVTQGTSLAETFWRVSTASPVIGSAIAFSEITPDHAAAAASAAAAAASATSAGTSATNAATSAATSSASATTATTRSTEAAASAAAAAASAAAAAVSAGDAADDADAASASVDTISGIAAATAVSQAAAAASATAAALSAVAAQNAAEGTGTVDVIYDTKDDANTALATPATLDIVMVLADETRNGEGIIYQKELNGTSSSSLAIGTGSKTLGTQAGLPYIAGDYVRIESSANPANSMQGLITSYSGTVMVVNVSAVTGSGTVVGWNIFSLVYKRTLPPSLLSDPVTRPMLPQRLLGTRSAGLKIPKAISDIEAGTKLGFNILVVGDSLGTYNWQSAHVQLQRLFSGHLQGEPFYAYGLGLLPNWGNQETTYGAVGTPLFAGTGTLNFKTDFDAAWDGTNVELAAGQYTITGWGGSGLGNQNNVYADKIQFFLIREPGAGSVRLKIAQGNLSPVTGSVLWRNPTADQITSSHVLTADHRAISDAQNNGSGLIRLTVADTTGWVTNDYLTVAGVTGTTEANGDWNVTVIDGTHIDLQGSAFANAYVSGGTAGSDNLIVDCDGVFGLETVELTVAFPTTATARWAGKIAHQAGGNVRTLSTMFAVETKPAMNMYRVTQASADFSDISLTAEPVMSELIAQLEPDIIVLENADQRNSWELALPIIESARQASGIAHLPAVIMVGNPFYENGPVLNDLTIAARIAYCWDWAASHVGYDVLDLMAFSGGHDEAAAAGWRSDSIHYNGEIVWRGVRRWAFERGYLPTNDRSPGGYADNSAILSAKKTIDRPVTADTMLAALTQPHVHDTGYCTWTFTNTGSATSARNASNTTLDLLTGTTAGSTTVARVADASPPWHLNQSGRHARGAGGMSTSVRVTNRTTNGVCRLLWCNRTASAAYTGDLTGEGFGFEIIDNVITGICWDDGAKVTSDPVTLSGGVTANWHPIQVILEPDAISTTRGTLYWYVNNLLLGTSNYAHVSNWAALRFEISNGADAVTYGVRFDPPRLANRRTY